MKDPTTFGKVLDRVRTTNEVYVGTDGMTLQDVHISTWDYEIPGTLIVSHPYWGMGICIHSDGTWTWENVI